MQDTQHVDPYVLSRFVVIDVPKTNCTNDDAQGAINGTTATPSFYFDEETGERQSEEFIKSSPGTSNTYTTYQKCDKGS